MSDVFGVTSVHVLYARLSYPESVPSVGIRVPKSGVMGVGRRMVKDAMSYPSMIPKIDLTFKLEVYCWKIYLGSRAVSIVQVNNAAHNVRVLLLMLPWAVKPLKQSGYQ